MSLKQVVHFYEFGCYRDFVYIFRLVMSFWLTIALIKVKFPSLAFLISFSLESISPDIRIVTPTCF